MQKIIKYFTSQDFVIGLALFALTLIIYLNTSIKYPTPYDYFIRLSKSFLIGQIYVTEHPAHLSELIPAGDNKWFVAYPPMPAIALMPFVAFDLFNNNLTLYSMIVGSLNISLAFLFFKRFFNNTRIGILIALAFGFGTSHWFLSTEGSTWYISHMFALFFLFSSLLTLQIKENHTSVSYSESPKRWLFSGLFLGFAFMSREQTSLAIIFSFSLPFIAHIKSLKNLLNQIISILITHKKIYLSFIAGFAVCLLFIFWYNYARFGTIKTVQHDMIPGLLQEPWFDKGFLNVAYIPRNIQFFFTKMPLPYEQFPYFKPSVEGMAYILVSPYILLIIFAKWKKHWVQLAFLVGCIMLIPPFMNGSNGFSQFGYRYAMEATPFFLLVFGSFLQRKIWWLSLPLIVSAFAISFWGIYFLRVLEIYGW